MRRVKCVAATAASAASARDRVASYPWLRSVHQRGCVTFLESSVPIACRRYRPARRGDRLQKLGFAHRRPDNGRMDISTDNPDHGFQFPGTFELSAMGTAERGLETELPRLLAATGVELLQESVSWKHSSSGKYVSVKIGFRAESREQFEAAHQALRDHPEVKWTL
ncbi:putative secreted protein [Xanthomonas euvesicatoria pv. vesicatoria str. 85-10]|uniref:UPF0250 protein XCV0727 n=6 Tax=Xanthomonas TaxID=338 RepID=Q3BXQ5_XANE5|nr:putative secreted protein [Xanthomonas euvesicatoria pv. vesicatoria str. 85-10]